MLPTPTHPERCTKTPLNHEVITTKKIPLYNKILNKNFLVKFWNILAISKINSQEIIDVVLVAFRVMSKRVENHRLLP